MIDRLTVQGETRGAVRHQTLALSFTNLLAKVGFARGTEFTLATLRGVKRNYVVTHFHTGNPFADGFNNATTFVTQNGWKDSFRVFTRQGERIGMANTAGNNANAHFTGLRWHNIHFFDRQRRSEE